MNLLNKRILIVFQPWGWGDYENSLIFPMVNELKSIGAEVEVLDLSNPPVFNKKGFIKKMKNIYWRNIKKNNNYYFFDEIEHYGKFYLNKCRKSIAKKEFDCTLVIRPDIYSEIFLKYIKKKSKKIMGYMWDGITQNQAQQLSKIGEIFNNIFVFDSDDITKYPNLNLKFGTNFFYDNQLNLDNIYYDSLYIGGIYINRKDKIVYDFFNKIIEDFKIIIFLDKGFLDDKQLIKDDRVSYIYKHMAYLETLKYVNKAKCILDICRPDHKGLSFRFFESLSLNKKIITNNKDVINYDFYNPNNILIIEDFEDFNVTEVKQFLNSNYEIIDQKIVDQYSFKNWFLRIFDISKNEN